MSCMFGIQVFYQMLLHLFAGFDQFVMTDTPAAKRKTIRDKIGEYYRDSATTAQYTKFLISSFTIGDKALNKNPVLNTNIRGGDGFIRSYRAIWRQEATGHDDYERVGGMVTPMLQVQDMLHGIALGFSSQRHHATPFSATWTISFWSTSVWRTRLFQGPKVSGVAQRDFA